MEWALGVAARCNHNLQVRITQNPSPECLRDGFFVMKPPFDIAGDLDTPVSAFAKLAPFEPRFLLESVEGGERLARDSFIGFGDGLEVRLDRDGFTVGAARRPVPSTCAELRAGLRDALRRAPHPEPDIAGVPLAGGLVGYSSYDVV